MERNPVKTVPILTNERVERTLSRIDDVLLQNRREQWIYIVLVILLFGAGIACLAAAIAGGNYGWSIPPMVTTGLLHWPLRAIRDLRRRNIALATAPMLIALLPAEDAVAELKRILHAL